MNAFKKIPSKLKKQNQWVVWKYEEREVKVDKGVAHKKKAKVPYSVQNTKKRGSVSDPSTWGTFKEALNVYRKKGFDGIGFVFTDKDDFVGVDLDNCRNPKTGKLTSRASRIVKQLDSYTEVSPSGKGVHVILEANCNKGFRKSILEVYCRGRYFTMTGVSHDELKFVRRKSKALKRLFEQCGVKKNVVGKIRSIANGKDNEPCCFNNDIIGEIIAGTHGEDIKRLWLGNVSKHNSPSERDFALCCKLSQLVGPNPSAIDAYFRKSGLYRSKWDRKDYADGTIQKAIESTSNTVNGVKNTADSEVLMEIMESIETMRTPMGECFGRIMKNDHYETWSLLSPRIKDFVRYHFFKRRKKVLSSHLLSPIIDMLSTKAKYEGRMAEVYVRSAMHNGNVYVDLCNEKWQVAEITPHGWKIIDDSPVIFTRSKASGALPVPSKNGKLKDLFKFLNVEDRGSRILITAFIIGAYLPGRPFIVLNLMGPQGSGKSTTAKSIVSLVDPYNPSVRRMPRNEHELHIFASNAHLLAFDNVSRFTRKMSDAMCAIATGTGYSVRELYTGGDEQLFWSKKPMIMNGIDMVGAGNDLLDRSIIVMYPRIIDRERMEEAKFWKKFEENAPSMLGGIFDAVSCALKNLDNVNCKKLPRMADFAKWVIAAEPALPWKKGEFIKHYRMNISCNAHRGIEGDIVAKAVISFVKDVKKWKGTSTDLKEVIECSVKHYAGKRYTSEETIRSNYWPKQPNLFSKRINEAIPFLEKCGVKVDTKKTGSTRSIVLNYMGKRSNNDS